MPKGAFYAFPNIKKFGMSSNEFTLYLLDEAGVAVIPGSTFGKTGEGFIRISYANSMDNLKEALSRVKKTTEKIL